MQSVRTHADGCVILLASAAMTHKRRPPIHPPGLPEVVRDALELPHEVGQTADG